MKFFLDTEFIENGKTIDLISIGVVADNGATFYAINRNCNFAKASDWVETNVLGPMDFSRDSAIGMSLGSPFKEALRWVDGNLIHPLFGRCISGAYYLDWQCPIRRRTLVAIANKSEIGKELKNWVEDTAGSNKIEFWGYYCDYDWVVLCQLFGTMMDLPKGWPMYCLDLKQECYLRGNPKLPKMEGVKEHNALDDAKEIKFRYNWLTAGL